MTLFFDVQVTGEYSAVPLEAPRSQQEVDGLQVRLARSEDGTFDFLITKDGEPVPLHPYLGAMGHLVVLRARDLAFLHVHPLESERPGEVPFRLHVSSDERHRAFLQFLTVDGELHTAAFTLS